MSDTLSCTFELNGRIADVGRACAGNVTLNGNPLTCNGANGWRAVDANTIEIVGDACNTYKTVPASAINATFPCNAVILI